MKQLFAPILFIYACVLFSITLIPVYIIILIAQKVCSEHRFAGILHTTFKYWMGIFMPLIGCPVSYKGRENFLAAQNYVVVINHNSLVDVPVSSPGIVGPNKTLAKIEMSKIPLFGLVYRAGSILVDRDDRRSKVESLRKMVNALEQGLHLCLYPEGTRNKTSQPLAPFFDGAFRVAIMAQKPIMPAIIIGTKNILHPTKTCWLWPHRIQFHFLPPIETTPYTTADIDLLKDKVYNIMKDYYVNNS